MAGHSHSANIARRKGSVDAKRANLFSKLARGVMVAARQGGSDPESNLDLRYAIDRAKAVSMPKDNIERAIKKGAGDLADGVRLESTMYEAVGPGGALILIEVLTDNRNRTAPEIRKILEKRNASAGSTAWAFERKGLIVVPSEGITEEHVMEVVLEAGAEDLQQIDDHFEITTDPADLEAARAALVKADIPVQEAGLTQAPKNRLALDDETAKKVLKLLEDLDDHDDVQNVYVNVDIPDALLAQEAG